MDPCTKKSLPHRAASAARFGGRGKVGCGGRESRPETSLLPLFVLWTKARGQNGRPELRWGDLLGCLGAKGRRGACELGVGKPPATNTNGPEGGNGQKEGNEPQEQTKGQPGHWHSGSSSGQLACKPRWRWLERPACSHRSLCYQGEKYDTPGQRSAAMYTRVHARTFSLSLLPQEDCRG